MPAGNRNEIGVRARRDRHPQNLLRSNFLEKDFQDLNINEYQSGRPTCVPSC